MFCPSEVVARLFATALVIGIGGFVFGVVV
jgi:hypothetical protein